MEGRDAGILHQCVTCCACREFCPTGADPFDLILREMEKRNAYPVGKDMVDVFELAGTIPSVITPGDPGKPALSICIMENSLPADTLKSRMFEGLTIAKGGDYFCYLGWVHLGRMSPVDKNAKKFIENLSALEKDIVFLHDDCYAMVNAKVQDYNISLPFRYMHIYEYMYNWLSEHISEIKPLGLRIAYQRPCASRFTPEKDAFLDMIFDLIGVKRVARVYDRENSLCCTAAFVRVYPDKAKEFQRLNLDDAQAAGADAMVTLCPMCDRVLKRPTGERGFEKIYITDLCRMALGEKPLPKLFLENI
jgi:Fe-S oxidoreductase